VKHDTTTKDHPVRESGAAGDARTDPGARVSTGHTTGAVEEAPIGGEEGDGPTDRESVAAVEPTIEDEYWSTHFKSRPYVRAGANYEEYRDAFRYGWESRLRTTSTWDEAAPSIEQGWDELEDRSELTWQDAREAVRDAWNRAGRAMTGDADRDGR